MAVMSKQHSIQRNIRIHDEIARKYDAIHHNEIFNKHEQERLRVSLANAIKKIDTVSEHKNAIDYGCGTGNLTKHLLALGCKVVSADVSVKSLEILSNKYNGSNSVQTMLINGIDLSSIKNNEYDITATYSVLHHVPDYLTIVRELIRITKPGGIIYLDHEVNDCYWQRIGLYREFLDEIEKSNKKGYLYKCQNYYEQIKYAVYKYLRYQPEGDIHVWPDDHIDWDQIEHVINQNNCDIINKCDYLLNCSAYSQEIFDKYKDVCGDYRCVVARKIK